MRNGGKKDKEIGRQSGIAIRKPTTSASGSTHNNGRQNSAPNVGHGTGVMPWDELHQTDEMVDSEPEPSYRQQLSLLRQHVVRSRSPKRHGYSEVRVGGSGLQDGELSPETPPERSPARPTHPPQSPQSFHSHPPASRSVMEEEEDNGAPAATPRRASHDITSTTAIHLSEETNGVAASGGADIEPVQSNVMSEIDSRIQALQLFLDEAR